MNAAAFRHFYEYHFAQNRRLWGQVQSLSEATVAPGTVPTVRHRPDAVFLAAASSCSRLPSSPHDSCWRRRSNRRPEKRLSCLANLPLLAMSLPT